MKLIHKGYFFHVVQRAFGCIFFVWFSVSVSDTEYVICVTWEGECLKYFNDTVVFHYTQNFASRMYRYENIRLVVFWIKHDIFSSVT
jgi:hypothetical protein